MFTPRSLGACGLVLSASLATQAHGALLFTGTSGNREAEATFEINGDELVITLANTSGFDVQNPADLLTGIFFRISCHDDDVVDSPELTPISAVLGDSSTVLFGDHGPNGDVGGEWAYREGVGRQIADDLVGISAVARGGFGAPYRFPGENLDPPVSPDGIGYSLTSEGDDPTTGIRSVSGGRALIQNEVVFTLSGIEALCEGNIEIDRVFVQYHASAPGDDGQPTSYFELPLIPAPGTAFVLAGGGLLALGRRRRS